MTINGSVFSGQYRIYPLQNEILGRDDGASRGVLADEGSEKQWLKAIHFSFSLSSPALFPSNADVIPTEGRDPIMGTRN
jgi:hypothetical protein